MDRVIQQLSYSRLANFVQRNIYLVGNHMK